MPLYEFQCEKCNHRFERMQGFNDPHPETCPQCGGSPVKQLISAPGVQFKGSGWYVTDYARSGGGSKKPESTGDSKSESKSDSKGSDAGSSSSSSSDKK